MKQVLIRAARLIDCPACERLGRIKELQVSDGKTFLPLWYYRRLVLEHAYFFVAVHKRRIIGFLVGEPIIGSGVLAQYLVIDRKYRRHGVATMLWDHFLRVIRSKKRSWILGYAVPGPSIRRLLKKRGAYFGHRVQEFGVDLEAGL